MSWQRQKQTATARALHKQEEACMQTQLDASGIYMWFWSVSHGLAGSDLISRVSYFDSDLTSRPTFGQQRLHLLSTHPPGDRLALHTPAQPANIPSTLHLNNSCSRRLYVAPGNYSFFHSISSSLTRLSRTGLEHRVPTHLLVTRRPSHA